MPRSDTSTLVVSVFYSMNVLHAVHGIVFCRADETPSTPLRPRSHFVPTTSVDNNEQLPDLALSAVPGTRYASPPTSNSTTTPRSAHTPGGTGTTTTSGRKKSRSRLSAIFRFPSISKGNSRRSSDASSAFAAEISPPLSPRSIPVTPLSSVPSSAKSSRSPTPNKHSLLKRGSSFREKLSPRKHKKNDKSLGGADKPNGARSLSPSQSSSASHSHTASSTSSSHDKQVPSPMSRQIKKLEDLERVSQVSLSRSFLKITQPEKEKDEKMDLKEVKKELLRGSPLLGAKVAAGEPKVLQRRSLPSSKSRPKSRTFDSFI